MARGGRAGALLILLAPTTVLLLATALPAASACSAPTLEVSATRVKPSQSLTVTGSNFVCDTTTTGGEASLTHIVITFVQGSVSHTLASVDTGSHDPFTIMVEIPANAHGGPAQIKAAAGTRAATAQITVVAGVVRAAGSLARTGAPLLTVGEVALIMLVIGTATRITAGIWES